MKRKIALWAVGIFFLVGCTTAPEPVEEVEPQEPVEVEPEEPVVEEVEEEEEESVAAEGEYFVGDEGPAGGLIFFVDRREEYEGLTYLEAAPEGWHEEGADPVVAWGEMGVEVGARETAIGLGRANTEAAAAHSEESAASLVAALVIGGFDDWFLPTQDELFQLYENLFRRDLGGLARERYWSSTETGEDRVQLYNFTTGGRIAASKDQEHRIRPIRAF